MHPGAVGAHAAGAEVPDQGEPEGPSDPEGHLAAPAGGHGCPQHAPPGQGLHLWGRVRTQCQGCLTMPAVHTVDK